MKQLSAFYKLQPWEDDKQDGLRYYFNNPNYPHGESIMLFCLLMHVQPKKVIEIGSGYSSCVILDTNELFFNNTIDTSFIEPYPDLFLSLIKPHDKDNLTIIPEKLQDVSPEVFASLLPGDVVLIDSTHVSKVDSDVNYILFTILPAIAPGVYIHFHDIFYPFEYPKEWIYEGRSWNELYILRAFLQYNKEFEIVLFNSYLSHFFKETLVHHMPLCTNAGTSIWLKKKHVMNNMAIALMQLELSEKLKPVTISDNYDECRILVRFHRQPLGWVSFKEITGGFISTEELEVKIKKQVGWPLVEKAFINYVKEQEDTFSSFGPISIVVCTRNRTKQLAECLKSLFALEYSTYEIIIVDNAPDNEDTYNLAKKFPVRYVREERPGLD